MAARTIYLSRLIGLVCLIVAAALIADKQTMVDTVGMVFQDRPVMLVFSIGGVVAGLAIVLAHNVWSKRLLPLVVTLVGWIVLIRGLLLLFLPAEIIAWVFSALRFADFFYLYAAIPLILGAYLTLRGFAAGTQPAPTRAAPAPTPAAKPPAAGGQRSRRRR